MGRNSKWVESQPDDSVEEVARRALSIRLERLWHFLESSVRDADEPEHVHQLRVFTRRSHAAMEIFSDWLPGRRGRWIHKQLKRLRKAAGEARDLDVLRIRWSTELETLPAGQSLLLLEQVKRRRRKAQWPIEDAYQKLAGKNFPKKVKKFLKRLRYRGPDHCEADGQPLPGQLNAAARQLLGSLLGPYFAAAAGPFDDVEALHAFRIQSKQVRYAMELFAGAFDDEFRQQLYPLVAELQDRLGKINDHVTALSYLAAWREQTDALAVRQALAAGEAFEQQALLASQQAFLSEWTAERREALQQGFARYVPQTGLAPLNSKRPEGFSPR